MCLVCLICTHFNSYAFNYIPSKAFHSSSISSWIDQLCIWNNMLHVCYHMHINIQKSSPSCSLMACNLHLQLRLTYLTYTHFLSILWSLCSPWHDNNQGNNLPQQLLVGKHHYELKHWIIEVIEHKPSPIEIVIICMASSSPNARSQPLPPSSPSCDAYSISQSCRSSFSSLCLSIRYSYSKFVLEMIHKPHHQSFFLSILSTLIHMMVCTNHIFCPQLTYT